MSQLSLIVGSSMLARSAEAAVELGALVLFCGWFKWAIYRLTSSCLVWVSSLSSTSPFSVSGPFHHFLSDHCGHSDHGRRACPQDNVSRLGFDICRGAISPYVVSLRPAGLSTRHVV